jgi:hypothetical protein
MLEKKSLTFLSLRLQKCIMVILKTKLVYGYPTHKQTGEKKNILKQTYYNENKRKSN